MARLFKDGHNYQWSISGQQGARTWSSDKNKFDVLIMNFETDDLNATEVLADLLGSNRVPQHTVIYLDASATPSMLADLAQELVPLIPPEKQVVLLLKGGDFALKLRLAIASVRATKQEQEV